MTSKMKKLFHRKRDDEESVARASQSPYSNKNDPAMHASSYDSTAPAGLPQTGDYPIKGNDMTAASGKQPKRKTSVRSWRSSNSQRGVSTRATQSEVPYGQGIQTSDTSSPVHPRYNDGYTHDHDKSNTSRGVGPHTLPPMELPQDFAAMNLGVHGPSTTTTHGPTTVTTTTTTFGQGPNGPRAAPPSNMHASSKKTSLQQVSPSDVQQAYTRNNIRGFADSRDLAHDDYEHQLRSPKSNMMTQNPTSIPRKEVRAAAAQAPTHAARKSSEHQSHYRQTEIRARPQANQSNYDAPNTSVRSVPQAVQPRASAVYGNTKGSNSSHRTRELESPISPEPFQSSRARTDAQSNAQLPSAQTITDRAKSNTYDTSVVEKVAPAVVHETVHKNIHHVREELITRETHDHDVYHRVLPVVDVEVLPPRHFLPVEGGGLVEIGASEVPGRGNNWVIAETASKIPSDQAPLRTGSRGFSARAFEGRDGDATRYLAPEGHEKTEQTWVHPPQLETGARDTGQSWPMEMGSSAADRGNYRTPKEHKKRSSKRHSHRTDGLVGRAG